MIDLLSRNHILLAGLCSALALVLGYELAMPAAALDVPVLQWRLPAQPGPLALATPFPASQSFAAIDARPLFNPARKPVQVPQTSAVAATPPPTDISLIGVIIEGDRRLAMLHTPSSPLEIGVEVGGEINGWQIVAIEPDHIVLHAGAADFPIALNAAHAGTPSMAPSDGVPGRTAPSIQGRNPPPPTNTIETPAAPTESGDQ
ncbi:MAG: hypothetical protein WDM86_02755 [Rhizomicrobium sp.]